jgi:hypothetical protein
MVHNAPQSTYTGDFKVGPKAFKTLGEAVQVRSKIRVTSLKNMTAPKF